MTNRVKVMAASLSVGLFVTGALAMTFAFRLSGAESDLETTIRDLEQAEQTNGRLKDELGVKSRSLESALERNVRLDGHVSDLEETHARLSSDIDELDSERQSLRQELRKSMLVQDALEADVDRLAAHSQTMTERYESLQDEKAEQHQSLQQSVQDLTDNIRAAEDARDELASELDHMMILTEALEDEREKLIAAVTALEDENKGLDAEIGRYRSTHQSVAELERQIAVLEQSITELEDAIQSLEKERAPLILKTYRAHPSCTGSMEPKITCLDTTTVLANFKPSDVVVGATIEFKSPVHGGRVLHRVMDIKNEGGIYYFWPKGDANPKPDGYWVSESDVYGYVVALERGTRPQNADLRALVNEAKGEADRLRGLYLDAQERFCGEDFRPGTGMTCHTSTRGAREVKEAYDLYINAWCAHHSAAHQGRHESFHTGPPRPVPPYVAPTVCS